MTGIQERVRSLAAGLSASEFADQCGLNRNTAKNLLADQERSPGIATLHKIASAMNRSLNWLMTGQGPEKPFEGERTSDDSRRQAEPTPLPKRRAESEEVRAEDVPLRRFVSFAESVWDDDEARVWLGTELRFLEEKFFERFRRLEKKWTTPASGNGVA